jgi:two-component system NtrC family response regulator
MAYGDWLASEGAAAYRNDSAAVEAYRAAMDHFERIGAEFKLGEARERLESLEARMKSEGESYAPTTAKVRPARRPRLSAELLRRSQWALDTFGMVTRNVHLLGMLEEIASVSVSDLPVLVLGESGTGKELVARGVHALSGRTGEFVAINCSAVPEQMLEGEFFGYMRGAFTNAVADKPGLFEVAHEGTVFLDEIGEMSLDLQSKMLRFLETGVLRRVGATRDTQVETRIVAATNRSRSGLQGGSNFRSDLYYRLAHAVYELPPLRERGDDVELLLDHFLEHFSRQTGNAVRLAPVVRTRLLAHGWPGTIRELRSVVNKVVVSVRSDGIVTPRELPLLDSTDAPANFLAERNAQEKKRVLRALEQADYNKTDAARTLRISRTTLLGMMKRLGVAG